MSTEIPNQETGQKDLNTRVYERFIQIIEYEDQNDNENWRTLPEFAYINLENNIGKSTIRDIAVEIDGDNNNLIICLMYIPSKLSLMELTSNKLGLSNCELYDVSISDRDEIERIKELYGEISMTRRDSFDYI
jgi:hypothetical protein